MNKIMINLKENRIQENLDQDWGFFIEIDAHHSFHNKREREKEFKKMYLEKILLEKIDEHEYEEEKYLLYNINDAIERIQNPKILFRKCTPYELFHLGTATIVFISLGYFIFCIA